MAFAICPSVSKRQFQQPLCFILFSSFLFQSFRANRNWFLSGTFKIRYIAPIYEGHKNNEVHEFWILYGVFHTLDCFELILWPERVINVRRRSGSSRFEHFGKKYGSFCWLDLNVPKEESGLRTNHSVISSNCFDFFHSILEPNFEQCDLLLLLHFRSACICGWMIECDLMDKAEKLGHRWHNNSADFCLMPFSCSSVAKSTEGIRNTLAIDNCFQIMEKYAFFYQLNAKCTQIRIYMIGLYANEKCHWKSIESIFEHSVFFSLSSKL